MRQTLGWRNLAALALLGAIVAGDIARASSEDPACPSRMAEAQSVSIEKFSRHLFATVAGREKGKNLFLSGASVSEALRMAWLGANGATRAELGRLLALPEGVSDEAVAIQWRTLWDDLRGADPKVTLRSANSVWLKDGMRVSDGWMGLVNRAHDADVRRVDFASPAFLPEINGWVAKKTEGMIPTILSPPIPDDALFYLVNAIFFDGKWNVSFPERETRLGEFQMSDGRGVQAAFMHRAAAFSYGESAGIQAVKIPYGETQRFQFYALLPQEGTPLEKAIEIATGNGMDNMIRRMRMRQGTVFLPRFKAEYGNAEFLATLRAMGLNIAASDAADFSRMLTDDSAKIDKIIHKAVIELEETGTKFAAATVIGAVRTTSIQPIEPPFVFRADHPFVYVIRDDKTGTTLAMGVLHEPKDPKGLQLAADAGPAIHPPAPTRRYIVRLPPEVIGQMDDELRAGWGGVVNDGGTFVATFDITGETEQSVSRRVTEGIRAHALARTEIQPGAGRRPRRLVATVEGSGAAIISALSNLANLGGRLSLR